MTKKASRSRICSVPVPGYSVSLTCARVGHNLSPSSWHTALVEKAGLEDKVLGFKSQLCHTQSNVLKQVTWLERKRDNFTLHDCEGGR